VNWWDEVISVNIETTTYCNRKCYFCPNKDMDKTRQMRMAPATILHIIAELVEVGYKGRVHPYMNGEPLEDPLIVDVVEWIREKLPTNHIALSTNGDFLTPELMDALLTAGLSELQVSCYDDVHKPILKHYWNNTPRYVGRVFFTKTDDLDEQCFYNRGGNVPEIKCNYDKTEGCWWVGKKLPIDWQGNVLVCCSDFYGEHTLGNVNDNTIQEIWDTDTFQAYRKAHADDMGVTMPMCADCNRMVGVD